MMRDERLKNIRKSIEQGLSAVNELIKLYIALNVEEKPRQPR